MSQSLIVGAALIAFGLACVGGGLALSRRATRPGKLDASQLLGSPQIACAPVARLGFAKKRARARADLGGRYALAPRFLGPETLSSATTPTFDRIGLLAITERDIALVSLVPTGWGTKPERVLARIPRSEVASTELGQGGIAPFTITFGNGDTWRLESSWMWRKDARGIMDALAVSTREATHRGSGERAPAERPGPQHS